MMQIFQQEANSNVDAYENSKERVTVGPYDILCGRNSTAFNNIGNRRFRVTIALNLKRYMEAKTRRDKTEVIISVLKLLREDVGARFLKRKGDKLVELSDARAREKVGHALRDLSIQQPIPICTTMMKKSSSSNREDDKYNKRDSGVWGNLEGVVEMIGEAADTRVGDLSLEPIPIFRASDSIFYARKAWT